jgi:hypothetical protein
MNDFRGSGDRDRPIRPQRPGGTRRPDGPAGRGQRSEVGAPDRPDWQQRVERTRDPNAEKSPIIPEAITPNDVDMVVRLQLKTLTPENAEMVARHLAMVSLLIEQDPELAHRHAKAASKRAGRIAVVRETVGITAYTVGEYALALRELLAFRRISGSNDQLPIMVDSERGLERPDRALELGRDVDRKSLSPMVRTNLAIAMSGAQLDLGNNELALSELEIPELNPAKVFEYSPPLFRAYADTLELLGREKDAKRWADLAQRAELAIAGGPEGEVFEVLEEIEIPVFSERPKSWDSDEPRKSYGDRGSSDRGSSDRPRRPFDNPGGERRGAPRGR